MYAIRSYYESVPPLVADIVMRCLAKRAADRWQTADELKAQFTAVATPQSGGLTPTGTQPVAAVAASRLVALNHPLRVALLFGVGAALVLVLVYGLMIALGLPNWVFVGAVVRITSYNVCYTKLLRGRVRARVEAVTVTNR